MVDIENRRRRYEILRAALEKERSSFLSQWKDLANYILPTRPKFALSETNRGERKNQKIIDSTATLATRTLQSGLMAGVTSPARPWFRLTTPDPDLTEYGPVKNWLHIVTQRMITVFLRSNLYNVLPIIYGDLGVFGTAAMYIEEDFEGDVIRCYPLPLGSYMLALDDRRKVRVFFREFRMTVRQLVDKFGRRQNGEIDWSGISPQVRTWYENDQRDIWVDICHVIEPNDNYRPDSLESKYRRYRSIYYEKSLSSYIDEDKYLRESGYDYFPVFCPRWEVTGEDIYATNCPGMTAIGDVKALQVLQKRKAQAIEKMINPPMVAPAMLRSYKASILPGDITYVDEREGQKGFRPAHEVRMSIQEIEASIAEHQARIRRAFFEDLFFMLTYSDRRQITAREIEERHQEKLLAIGPVLEQLNQDLLDPLIDITFAIMVRQGLVPEPPEDLQGTNLKVEYISIMAQAQKMAGLVGIERFANFAGQIAQFAPLVLDKIDADQLIDEYGNITGVPPHIIRPDDAVAELRQARAAEQQSTQQLIGLKEGAAVAKDLTQADMEGNNVLTELINRANAGKVA